MSGFGGVRTATVPGSRRQGRSTARTFAVITLFSKQMVVCRQAHGGPQGQQIGDLVSVPPTAKG